MSMIKYKNIRQMHIELTSKCNASCPGCPRNVSGGYPLPWIDKREWSLSQFKEVFTPELLKGCRTILFCGNYGDPGTCRDLVEIVDYIKQCHWEGTVRVHTNGGMRNPTFWRKLADKMNPQHDRVIFSVDGLEDTNHMYRRKVQWSKLYANMKAFIDAGGAATWEFLIFGHNQHQLNDAKALSEELGFKDFFYKKAFGFTEEKQGRGLDSMLLLDDNGLVEGALYPPDDEWTNSWHLEAGKNQGKSNTRMDPLVPDVFKRSFKNEKESLDERIQKGHLSWLDSSQQIDCMSIRNQEIYVDAQGGVHPCCFLGHVSQDADGIINMQYYEWVDKNIGFDNINIIKHGLQYVLDETDYFSKIKDTWDIKKHSDGRIAQCTKHCQVHNNPIDSLYESVRIQEDLRKTQIDEQQN